MTLIKMDPGDGGKASWLERRFGRRIADLFRAVPPAVMAAVRDVVLEKDEMIRQQEARLADLEAEVKDLSALRGIIAVLVRRMGGSVEFRQGELREVQTGSVLAVAKQGRGDGPGVRMLLSLRAPDAARPATTDLRPGS